MPAWGLDIGSSSIKLIALSGSEKQPKLESFGLAVNPVGNLETENPQEQVQIAQAIKKLVQDSGVKQRKAVVALSETKVFSRVIETPVLSESELASAIAWEAEQYIPIPVSEVQLDYRVLSQPKVTGAGARMQVFLVAAPIAVVNKMMSLVELAGLEIEALETEMIAVARALVRETPSPSQLLIHLGAGTTDLCIVENGMLVLIRTLPSGGNALSRGLASDLGLEFAQAEQYKRSYGLDGSQLQGKVRTALWPVFNSILGEIRKAISFYASSRRGKVVRVILSGGGAYLPGITGELARELGIEVVVGNPFAAVAMEQKQMQRIGNIMAVFSVAAGLALRNL